MIKISLNCSKIPKDKIKSNPKWKGQYLDLVLIDRPDEKGNDGFVSVDTTKEERDRGEKGVIVGNWKHLGQKTQPRREAPPPAKKAPQRDPDLDADDGDIPFNCEAHDPR